MFRLSDLAIIGTSENLDEEIICISGNKNIIYCGCEKKIYAFKRAKHVSMCFSNEGSESWRRLIFVDKFLCAVDGNSNIVIWNLETTELLRTLKGRRDVADIMPLKGTGKPLILIATKAGEMQIVDIVSNDVLGMFTFENKSITVLHQMPETDMLIAIGCADGSVLIHNVGHDVTVSRLRLDDQAGSITRLCSQSPGLLLIGTQCGWVCGSRYNLDISQQNLDWVKRDVARCGRAITSLLSLPGRVEVILTGGEDNGLRTWTMEGPNGSLLQRSAREGHWRPVRNLQFWDKNRLVSAGDDGQLRTSDCRLNSLLGPSGGDCSLGRAYDSRAGGAKRSHRGMAAREDREQYALEGPTSLALCTTNSGHWDTMATTHAGSPLMATWDYQRRCRGRHLLNRDRRDIAESCCISYCGNFVFVGHRSGALVKYNIQSGICRGTVLEAHSGPITSMSTACHLSIVTCGSLDGVVRRWAVNAKDLTMMAEYILPQGTPIYMVMAKYISQCLALALGPIPGSHGRACIQLLSTRNMTLYTELQLPASNLPITGVAFSNDDHIVVAQGDLIRTFNYMDSVLVDCMRMSKPVVSLCVSTESYLLALALEGQTEVYLWGRQVVCTPDSLPWDWVPKMDQIQTGPKVTEEISSEDEDIIDLDDEEDEVVEAVDMKKENNRDLKKQQKLMDLVKYSSMSSAQLGMLQYGDFMKAKMSGVSGIVKEDELDLMPDFVETPRGLEIVKKARKIDAEVGKKRSAKDMRADACRRETVNSGCVMLSEQFAELVHEQTDETKKAALMKELTSLTPGAIDKELLLLERRVDIEDTAVQWHPLQGALLAIQAELQARRQVELCSTLVNKLLDYHGDDLVEARLAGDEEALRTMNMFRTTVDSANSISKSFRNDLAQLAVCYRIFSGAFHN